MIYWCWVAAAIIVQIGMFIKGRKLLGKELECLETGQHDEFMGYHDKFIYWHGVSVYHLYWFIFGCIFIIWYDLWWSP